MHICMATHKCIGIDFVCNIIHVCRDTSEQVSVQSKMAEQQGEGLSEQNEVTEEVEVQVEQESQQLEEEGVERLQKIE